MMKRTRKRARHYTVFRGFTSMAMIFNIKQLVMLFSGRQACVRIGINEKDTGAGP